MADALYVATAVAAGVIATSCAAGWTADHTQQIAGSWADGKAQVTAWWRTGQAWWANTRTRILPALGAVAAWLLAHVPSRAHGRHRRAGVAA